MRKKTKIIIISVVCGAVIVGLALGLGLGLGLKPRENACSHDKTFVRSTPATCTEEGREETICVKCNKTISSQTTDAFGHSYGSWKTVVNPTEKRDGVMRRICANDGAHAETKAVPKLDKNDYDVQITAADCAKVGKKVYTSAQYGTYVEVLPKLMHDYDYAVTKTDTSGERPCEMLYCPVCNTKIASKNLNYELSADGTYFIVKGRIVSEYNDADLVIPAYHNGKPVREIGSEAFYSVGWLKSVTIPETITTIGSGAFNMGECTSNPLLSKIYFNAVNCNDFNGKNWVFIPWANGKTPIELVVGAEVTRIPANMFFPLVTNPDRTTLLSKVTFEENCSVTEIGSYAFYKTNLKELDLPSSVEKIGDFACYGTSLQSVKFSDSITAVGDSAFAACRNLQSVVFGAGLKTIGDDCFNYCGELSYIDMSASQVERIGVDAFKNCEKLQSVKLSGVTASVGDSAFENCVSLTDCQLGSSLIELGNRVFYGCVNLQSIIIPKPLRNLGCSTFENCVKLSFIRFDAAACADLVASNRTFANAGKDVSLNVTFGASVQNIPARLFYSSAEASANVTIAKLYLDWNLEKVSECAFLGVTINEAYFNSDGSSWNSVSVQSGNDVLKDAVSTYFTEVSV